MRLRTLIVLCLTVPPLNACGYAGKGTEFCQIGKPIYIGKEDRLTDQTARQILEHDETGAKLCAWGRL